MRPPRPLQGRERQGRPSRRRRPCRAPWILRAPAFCPASPLSCEQSTGALSLVRNGNHRHIPERGRGASLLCSLSAAVSESEPVCSECPTASGSYSWPLHRALQLRDPSAQPGPTAAASGGTLRLPVLHLHSSVTGLRVLWVCSPPSLQLSHSLLLSKVCNFQQLLLISVSHWRRSFLYCKETYLRLPIAVWLGVFLQTPRAPARSSGGRGRCCHQSNGQRRMS